MYTLREKFSIAYKWFLSYFRTNWKPTDYPTRLRHQQNVPLGAEWCAQVLNWPGPVGLGTTPAQALANLHSDLGRIKEYRTQNNQAMPRPGAKVPIQFASVERVNANALLLDDFLEHVLEFGPSDPVFVSDLSSLTDFGDDRDILRFKQRIQERYAVQLPESMPLLIADVLEYIRVARKG